MHGLPNLKIYTDVQCTVLRIMYIEQDEREPEFYGTLWSSNLVLIYVTRKLSYEAVTLYW